MNETRFLDLLDALLDRRLSESDRTEIEQALAESAEQRRMYWEYMLQHSALAELLKEEAGATLSRAWPAARRASCSVGRRPLARPGVAIPLAAAAAIVAGVLLAWAMQERPPDIAEAEPRSASAAPRADGTSAPPAPAQGAAESPPAPPEGMPLAAEDGPPETTPLGSGAPPSPGESSGAETRVASVPASPLGVRPDGEGAPTPGGHVAYLDALEGDVELARGGSGAWVQAVAGAPISSGDRLRTKLSRARVAFESGSALYVNRWTTLALSAVEGTRTPLVGLVGGEVYVEVSPADRGFAVETPHGRAVDLGTRFAVEVKPAGTTVVVVEGSVRASTDAGEAELMANQEVFLVGRASRPGRVRTVKELDNRLAAWTAGFKSPVAKAPLWRLVDDFEGGMTWREVPGLDIVCELTEQDRRSGRFCLKLVYEARENRPKPYGFAERAIKLREGDRSIVFHVRPIVWRPDARWMVHLKERDGDVWALSEGSMVKLAQQSWSAIQVDLEPPKGRKFTRTEAAGDGWFEPSSVETILLGVFGRQKGITELHVDDVLILQKQ